MNDFTETEKQRCGPMKPSDRRRLEVIATGSDIWVDLSDLEAHQ